VVRSLVVEEYYQTPLGRITPWDYELALPSDLVENDWVWDTSNCFQASYVGRVVEVRVFADGRHLPIVEWHKHAGSPERAPAHESRFARVIRKADDDE
jgi:hypothetical protein